MLPKVVVHNQISLDGSIKGFDVDLGVYYGLVGAYRPDALLVGSVTAKAGAGEAPAEEESDFRKPKPLKDDERPLWALVDSWGVLEGVLHVYRRSEYCRNVVVLVSEKTPEKYLKHLEERQYDFVVAGRDRVSYRRALEELRKKYGVRTVVTDSGGTLNSVLLEKGLVDELSIIISPSLVGDKRINLFRMLKTKENISLRLLKNETLEGGLVHVVYAVDK